ncbi:hypothetical protein B0T24DRAFT_670675 [Lasiosphaeria ovina]|uniref:Uncharacterized protein n=1 Tax=Lasiosphaeria ovina TaxID=92902 RepID=A0AAE0MZG6_9PEZI|nr:hypothetical protein B0T24DRAFT_670675 [Lasiosphaeria ovina]
MACSAAPDSSRRTGTRISSAATRRATSLLSVYGFLACLFVCPTGLFFDHYGAKWLLLAGSAAYVVSFIGLAYSSAYGQFMVCVVVAGVSAAPPTTVAFSVIRQWFKANEGIATGFLWLLNYSIFAYLPWTEDVSKGAQAREKKDTGAKSLPGKDMEYLQDLQGSSH